MESYREKKNEVMTSTWASADRRAERSDRMRLRAAAAAAVYAIFVHIVSPIIFARRKWRKEKYLAVGEQASN